MHHQGISKEKELHEEGVRRDFACQPEELKLTGNVNEKWTVFKPISAMRLEGDAQRKLALMLTG